MKKFSAQEMLERLRKKYPHLNLQLGTADDYEASLVIIDFLPRRPQGGSAGRKPSAAGVEQGGNRSASGPQKQGDAPAAPQDRPGRRRSRKGFPGQEGK